MTPSFLDKNQTADIKSLHSAVRAVLKGCEIKEVASVYGAGFDATGMFRDREVALVLRKAKGRKSAVPIVELELSAPNGGLWARLGFTVASRSLAPSTPLQEPGLSAYTFMAAPQALANDLLDQPMQARLAALAKLVYFEGLHMSPGKMTAKFTNWPADESTFDYLLSIFVDLAVRAQTLADQAEKKPGANLAAHPEVRAVLEREAAALARSQKIGKQILLGFALLLIGSIAFAIYAIQTHP